MVIDPVANLATQQMYGNGLMPSLNGWNVCATALPNGSNTILSGTARTNANDTKNDGTLTQCFVKLPVRNGVDTDRRTLTLAQWPPGNGRKTTQSA
jgi:hypothetical protein